MKETWQKAMVLLLILAIAAAGTIGQKGMAESGREMETGRKNNAETETGRENGAEMTRAPEQKNDRRIAREGKLLEGWTQAPCIVIDAGHGGYDPGKMGINQVAEKDVNLAIAKLLRDDLEASGVKVVMTREEDEALCGEGEDNAKVRDLKTRIRIIEEANPVAAVSVHQNSYPDDSVHGAQVFFHETSGEGKRLAEAIQTRLIREVDPENGRQVKGNNSYYLLKKTSVPIVIAECGFLSNWDEAQKLADERYQEEVAWALYLGIMDYLEKK